MHFLWDTFAAAMDMLLLGLQSLFGRLPLIWSEAVFEIDGIPTAQAGDLILVQEPYVLQDMLCSLLGTAGLVSSSSATEALCSYRFRNASMPGKVISQPCARRPWLISDGSCECTESSCVIKANPFHDPCLWFEPSRSGHYHDIQSTASTALAKYYINKDGLPMAARPFVPSFVYIYLLRLLAGMAFVALAAPLAESRLFHYVLAAAVGGVVASLVAAYFFYSLGKYVMDIVPGGRMMSGLAVPMIVLGGLNQRWFITILQMILSGNVHLWDEGIFGVEWAGKAYFGTSAAFSMLAVWYWGIFLPSETASQGRLSGQSNLRRLIQFLGLRWLLLSSRDLETACAVSIVLFYLDTMMHWQWRLRMWYEASPLRPRPQRQSLEEYDRLGKDTTERELAKLRVYLKGNMGELKKVSDRNMERCAAFAAHGMPHVGAPPEEADEGTSSCAIS
ncbi:unnamed protein product [Chrysoparadoxa australica]